MKINIKYRLFVAMLAATAVVVVSMFLILQWSMERGFLSFVNTQEQERLERLADELGQSYAGTGSWDFLRNDPGAWFRYLATSLPRDRITPEIRERIEMRAKMLSEQPPRTSNMPLPPHLARHFEMRVVLLDAQRVRICGPPTGSESVKYKPVRAGGQTVGYVGVMPRKILTDAIQLRFLKQQKVAMGLVAVVMLLVSAGISLPLAARLLRPVRSLAAATHRLASGRFDTRVEVTSNDELGQLASDFNSLALTLEKNEEARRQWVADISHELRTPLAVLRGEIEAIQDGIHQSTPETIRSLHGEVMHLGRLVDDLYQLSVSDLGALTYRKEELDLPLLVSGVVDSFKTEFARRGIRLRADLPAADFQVFADPERLHQLFDNLLGNSLAYTDAGGELDISVERQGGRCIVTFQDSAPGVPEHDLPRLFDRLYRVEGSRSRSTGGAGLGLAISRNIVEAHGGIITALPSPLGGLLIRVELPLTETKT